MKPEQLYQHLKELAEKLGVAVNEQNLRNTAAGIRVKSGLCRVKGEIRFIMDKRMPIRDKIDVLASSLARFPHEDIYVIPAVRDALKRAARFESREQGTSDSNP